MRARAWPSVSRSERGLTVTPRLPSARFEAAATMAAFESIIFFIDASSCDVSSLPRTSTRCSESPSASFSAMSTTAAIGRVMLRVMPTASRKTTTSESEAITMVVKRALCSTEVIIFFFSSMRFVDSSSIVSVDVSMRRMWSLIGASSLFASAAVLSSPVSMRLVMAWNAAVYSAVSARTCWMASCVRSSAPSFSILARC